MNARLRIDHRHLGVVIELPPLSQQLVDLGVPAIGDIKEIRPGVFRAECNGRLNPFSGLDVVFEVSRGGVSTVSGSMRAGSRGQSVSIFKVDHKTQSLKMNLLNPAWIP